MISESREFQQRVSEIKESLEGMNPREIDIVLSQAKIELFKPKPFEELTGIALFERQVSRMIDRGYPKELSQNPVLGGVSGAGKPSPGLSPLF
jgi:hypothetical protein